MVYISTITLKILPNIEYLSNLKFFYSIVKITLIISFGGGYIYFHEHGSLFIEVFRIIFYGSFILLFHSVSIFSYDKVNITCLRTDNRLHSYWGNVIEQRT